MMDSLQRILGKLGETPWLQGLLAACCTFILEDPTTVGCGVLVADGRMAFWTAFFGVGLGIALGDLGLYLIGYWLGPRVEAWGLMDHRRLEAAHDWYNRNLVAAVIVSRCIPGTRVPAFMAAGVLRADPMKFVGLVVAASLVWTFALLTITVKVGEQVLPYLGSLKWPFAILVLIVIILVHRHSVRKAARLHQQNLRHKSPVSLFELWPPALFYIPVAFYWIYLGIRYRSLTLPTAANPSVYSGGLLGESKSEILNLVPDPLSKWVAPWVVFTPDPHESPARNLTRAGNLIAEADLSYPLVAKPDKGQRGTGVRRIRDEAQLAEYLEAFPAGVDLMLQTLVPWDNEAGILYYRYPGETQGQIFSITLKTFPKVTGDGESTLRQLILEDDRARLLRGIYFGRHEDQLDVVLPEGQTFDLVFSGNHCQGTIFKNGIDTLTDAMADRFHQIASAMPEFYFGRFDVRFSSLEDLQRGEGFSIVEINGAGAEATHIWDADTRLGEAYRTLFEQFRILFRIGHLNRKEGAKPLPLAQLVRDFRAWRRKAGHYPVTE